MDHRCPTPWSMCARSAPHFRRTRPPRSGSGSPPGTVPGITLAALTLTLTLWAAVSQAEPANTGVGEPEPPNAEGIDNIREFGTARSDHQQIALAIAQCHDFADPRTWHAQVKTVLMLGLNERLGHTPFPEEASESRKVLAPNQYQRAAISFSDKLSRERLFYRDRLERSRARAALTQWGIICAGAVATVLVGIKAVWPAQGQEMHRMGVAIGIAALMASASSTALTSMDSYYGSKDEVVRDARTLAQLQQLHWRIVSDVVSTRDLCGNMPAREQQDHVNAWKERLEQVLNEAMPSFAKPGDVRFGPNAPAPDKLPARSGTEAYLGQER